MSKTTAIIRYDGAAVSEHSMDARDLAPALSALSDLVNAANREVNGDHSTARVLVSVHPEQRCFEFQIEIISIIAEHLVSLFDDELPSKAETIAHIIGLLGGTGLFALYRWMAKQDRISKKLKVQEGNGRVTILNPHNNRDITVNNVTFNLMMSTDTSDQVKAVIGPLTKTGYDRLQFEKDGLVVENFTAEDGRDMYALNVDIPELDHGSNVSTARTKVKVKKPDLIGGSMWSVVHHKTIDVRMEDQGWLTQFHSAKISIPAGSYLDVDLRMEIKLDSNHDPIGDPRYCISKVYAVIPPDQQKTLFG